MKIKHQKTLTISFSDTELGIVKIQPRLLKKEIQKYIDKHGVESVFVNGRAYQGEKINYEL